MSFSISPKGEGGEIKRETPEAVQSVRNFAATGAAKYGENCTFFFKESNRFSGV
jgi:hypothetical protein